MSKNYTFLSKALMILACISIFSCKDLESLEVRPFKNELTKDHTSEEAFAENESIEEEINKKKVDEVINIIKGVSDAKAAAGKVEVAKTAIKVLTGKATVGIITTKLAIIILKAAAGNLIPEKLQTINTNRKITNQLMIPRNRLKKY